MDEWISVKNGLPKQKDVGKEFLCCLKLGLRWRKILLYNDGYFGDVPGRRCEFVTHWMPLPELPKGDENDFANRRCRENTYYLIQMQTMRKNHCFAFQRRDDG